jgi:hypothetical protein
VGLPLGLIPPKEQKGREYTHLRGTAMLRGKGLGSDF